MRWEKEGMIYAPDGSLDWAATHAMLPTPDPISTETIRVYVGCCDAGGVGRIGYVDMRADDPRAIVGKSERPVLGIGAPGCFDDNGVVPTSIVTLPNGDKYLYFVGFELGASIRYRLFTGLAVSTDGGNTFGRASRAPILDRSDVELFFRCGTFVLYDNGLFRMWYVAGSEWTEIDGKSLPVYLIKYLESKDGITWGDKGVLCLDVERSDEHGFGRPWVVKRPDGTYQMYYSIRKRNLGYRLGYAESGDGINWHRMDGEIGLDVSSQGWDSEMLCYPAILANRSQTFMLYNGNGFGRTGFGYARLAACNAG